MSILLLQFIYVLYYLHVMQKKLITIAVSEENYQKLKTLGQAGDSFNDVLTKLIAEHKRGKG